MVLKPLAMDFVQLAKYKVATNMTAIKLSAIIELCLVKIDLEKQYHKQNHLKLSLTFG